MTTDIDIEQPPKLPIEEGQTIATNPIDQHIVEETPLSLDAQLVEQDETTTKTESFPIVENSPEAVAFAAAATDFTRPVEQVAQSMSRYVDPSGAIKDLGQGLIAAEIAALGGDFALAAASGNSLMVQKFAEAVQFNKNLSANLNATQALHTITTKAVENVATASPAALENNPLETIAKVAKEQGRAAAQAILLDQLMKQKYGTAVSTVEGLGSVVTVVGSILAAARVTGPWGWLASGGFTAMSVLDQIVFRNSIKKHANIDVGEKWGISDTLEAYNNLTSRLPVNQALALDKAILKDIVDNSDRLPFFLGKVFAMGNAASLHTAVRNAPGWDISARTRDALDAIGVVADIGDVIRYVKAIGSPAKSLEIAAGGSKAGEQLASDIVTGKNTLNIPAAQQIEYSLSNNIAQILPEGVRNTAGSVQKTVMENTRQLLKNLDERIVLTGDDKLKEMREFVAQHFEVAPTSVARYNSETGELILQHPGRAAPFTSEKTAKAFAQQLEKETGWKLEVIPTNKAPSAMGVGRAELAPLTRVTNADIDSWIDTNSFGDVFHGTDAPVISVLSTSKAKISGLGPGIYTTPIYKSGANYAVMRAVEAAKDTEKMVFMGSKRTYTDHLEYITDHADDFAAEKGVSRDEWLDAALTDLDTAFDNVVKPIAKERGNVVAARIQKPDQTLFLQRTREQQPDAIIELIDEMLILEDEFREIYTKYQKARPRYELVGEDIFAFMRNKYGDDAGKIMSEKYGIHGLFNNNPKAGAPAEFITFEDRFVDVLKNNVDEIGAKPLNYNDKLEKFIKSGTATTNAALALIRMTSKDAGYRMLAGKLSALRTQLGLENVILTTKNIKYGNASYGGVTDTISIGKRLEGSELAFLHEFVHATSLAVLERVIAGKLDGLTSTQIKAAKSVMKLASDEKVIGALEKAARSSDELTTVNYLRNNPHELLTHALIARDPFIFNTLNTLTIGGSSIINKIVGLIKDVLGIKSGSTLERLHSDYYDILVEQTAASRALTQDLVTDVYNLSAPLSHGWYVRLASQAGKVHDPEDIATRLGAGLDPKHQASMESMHERFVTLLQEQRDKKNLSDYIASTIGKLGRGEFKRVDKVLKEGDVVGREFNDVELAARGVKTDKEKVAYYAFRTLENLSLNVKNQHIVKQLTRDGWMQGYVSVGGEVVATPVKLATAASLKGEQAYNLATKQWTPIIGNETNLYISKKTFDVGDIGDIGGMGDSEATLFLRTGDDLHTGAWTPQLPALPGSYRRVYNQDYFGHVSVTRTVNGKQVPDILHLRTSNSGKDMDAWARGMNNILKEVRANNISLRFIEDNVGKWEDPQAILNSINKGEWNSYTQFNHHFDRDVDNYITSLTKAASDAYDLETRARGMRLESLDKVDNIVSPMSSLGAELTNISRLRNVAEWRDKWVDVWWNTYKDTIDPAFVRGRKPIEVISDTNLQTSMYTGGSTAAKFAESQRNYILQQLGAQTLSERVTEGWLRRLTFNHLNKYVKLPLMEEPVHIGYTIRNFDPIQFARSFNFHTMLGAFNPAQLIVQSQAMLNITAISPVHGTKAALSMPVLRVAMMSDNEKVWRTVAKASGMSDDEFVTTVKALKRSGLIDGIGATSLHNVEAGALNMFNSWTGKVGKGSTFFFNRGEEASRITAFDTARREWLAANKGADFTTDAAMVSILARTDDLTQNMTRSNLAAYQRGIWSLPMQFMQYQVKLAANIVGSFTQAGAGRGFTRGEASRIIAAHVLAYGMAGNGLTMLYDEVAQGYERVMGKKLTQEQKLFIVEGGLAWAADAIAQEATGEEMKLGLGTRLGTFNWYNTLIEAAVRADTPWWKAALGASATIPNKIGSLRYLADPFTTGDLSPEAFASATNKVLKNTFSSWNNATKAVYAYQHQGRLVSKQGTIIGNLSFNEVLAQAVGMPAEEVHSWYRYMKSVRELRNATTDFAKEYMRLDEIRVDLLRETGGVYNDRINQYTQAQAALVQAVPAGMMDVFDGERKKLWDMRNSEHGKPKLVDKYREIMTKGVKVEDAPLVKTYGMEN